MSMVGLSFGGALRKWTGGMDGGEREIMVFFAGRGLWGRLFFFCAVGARCDIWIELFHVEHMMGVNARLLYRLPDSGPLQRYLESKSGETHVTAQITPWSGP